MATNEKKANHIDRTPNGWIEKWKRDHSKTLSPSPPTKVVDYKLVASRISFSDVGINDTLTIQGSRERIRDWLLVTTEGDGTCFVHAILLILSPAYRSLSNEDRRRAGQYYRTTVLPILFGTYRDELVQPFMESIMKFRTELEEKMIHLLTIDPTGNLVRDDIIKVEKEIEKNKKQEKSLFTTFDRYLAEFIDPSIYIDDGVLPYLHRLYKVGFIYMTIPFSDKEGYHPFSLRQISSNTSKVDLEYVMICHTGKNHYEALVRPTPYFFTGQGYYTTTSTVANAIEQYAATIPVDQQQGSAIKGNSIEDSNLDAAIAASLSGSSDSNYGVDAATLALIAQLRAKDSKDNKPNTRASGPSDPLPKPICESPKKSSGRLDSLEAREAYALADQNGIAYENNKASVCEALCYNKLISQWIHNKVPTTCGTRVRKKNKKHKSKTSRNKNKKSRATNHYESSRKK